MENSSVPSHIFQTFTASGNGTLNSSSYMASQTDYTTYCKVALILLSMMITALISGFVGMTRAIMSQATPSLCCHVCHSHALDIEAQASTSPLDGYNTRRRAQGAGLPRNAARGIELPDSFGGDASDPSPQQESPPPSWERRGRNLLKTVQTAAAVGGWATHAMNALAVTVSCVLGGPPSLQYNLPTPVTESGRPN